MTTLSLWGCPEDDVVDPMTGTPIAGTPMGGNPPSTGLVSSEELSQIESLASKICQAVLSCEGYFSQEDCERKYVVDILDDISIAHFIMAEGEGRVAYNFSAISCLSADLDELMARGVNCETLFEDLPDCPKLIKGLVEDGQPCTYGMECSDTSSCQVEDECMSVVGVCQPNQVECSTDQECVENYGSNATCRNSYCNILRAQEGESCEQTSCDGTLECDENFICVNLAPLMEGEACYDYQRRCAAGLLCPNDEAGVCQRPAQQGEACTISEGTLSLSTCENGLYCEGLRLERGSMGTCQAIPAIGMACGDSLPRQFGEGFCGFYRSCINGVCVEPNFTGEACNEDLECYSQSCVNGSCSYFDLSYCE